MRTSSSVAQYPNDRKHSEERNYRKRERGRGHLKMRRKRGEEKGRRRERWALGLTLKVPRVSKAKDANARGRKEGRKRAGFRGALTIARNLQMNERDVTPDFFAGIWFGRIN